MAKHLTEFDDELTRYRIAREEFLTAFCGHWPAIYKAACPLTDKATVLFAWKRQIEAAIQADCEAWMAEQQNPYERPKAPMPKFMDWEGFSGIDRAAMGLALPPEIPGLPPIRHGQGIDPADGRTKPYREFARVASDARAAGAYELYQAWLRSLELVGQIQEATDPADIERLKDQRSENTVEYFRLRRERELRAAGEENAAKVRRLHELEDQRADLDRRVFDEKGDFKVAAGDPDGDYQQWRKVVDEIEALRKELRF